MKLLFFFPLHSQGFQIILSNAYTPLTIVRQKASFSNYCYYYYWKKEETGREDLRQGLMTR